MSIKTVGLVVGLVFGLNEIVPVAMADKFDREMKKAQKKQRKLSQNSHSKKSRYRECAVGAKPPRERRRNVASANTPKERKPKNEKRKPAKEQKLAGGGTVQKRSDYWIPDGNGGTIPVSSKRDVKKFNRKTASEQREEIRSRQAAIPKQ